jgi:prophage regulatory protein
MQPKVDKPPRILRMTHVADRVGLSKSSIFALIADGKFPRPFPLTPNGRAVGWLECDIDDYILARRHAVWEGV